MAYNRFKTSVKMFRLQNLFFTHSLRFGVNAWNIGNGYKHDVLGKEITEELDELYNTKELRGEEPNYEVLLPCVYLAIAGITIQKKPKTNVTES